MFLSHESMDVRLRDSSGHISTFASRVPGTKLMAEKVARKNNLVFGFL